MKLNKLVGTEYHSKRVRGYCAGMCVPGPVKSPLETSLTA